MEFEYDASGQRIVKKVLKKNGDIASTYYLRDASGNVMSVYSYSSTDNTPQLSEQYLYGSARVGMYTPGANVLSKTRGFGRKSYELSDHLGNVRATLSDYRRTASAATVNSATDYYPFGMIARMYVSSQTYRYGFNTQEKVDELGEAHTTAEYWEYDGRLGKRWNIDPMFKKFAWQSAYATLNNNPIFFKDIKGDTAFRFTKQGCYIGTFDDGKKEWSIQVYKHRITKDGKELDIYDVHHFNDPENDVRNMKLLVKTYGNNATLIHLKTKDDVRRYMDKSGATSAQARKNSWSYADKESTSNMDFWAAYLADESINGGISEDDVYDDRGAFYIFEGNNKAYNTMDAGNYLWGGAMKNLGISEFVARSGAHYNNATNGGPGSGILDAASDQRAISDAYSIISVYPDKPTQ